MLTNLEIAEALARRGESADKHRARAYRRAAGAALGWPVEAADVLEGDGSLEDLPGIGEKLAGRIEAWIEDPPDLAPPPPARSGFVSRAWARRRLAEEPGWKDRLQGDLQMHSNYSDGKASLAEMAVAAAGLGYSYIAITDHSGGQPVPPGLSPEAMEKQRAEVAAINEDLGDEGAFVILHGIEMNLKTDGSGDTDSSLLEPFDLVLGSFHSQLRRTEDQTERYLGAVRNPDVHVLAHPTARRFDLRPGLAADWDKVFRAAAESHTAVELNSHPHRQDLTVELASVALEAGAFFTIGTDAHDPGELENVDIALAIALEAGVPPERILNLGTVEAVREWGSG